MNQYNYEYLGVFFFVLLLILILATILYIIGSIGLYKMAKNDGVRNAWLAWVPIGNYYILGYLLKDKFTIFGWRLPSPQISLILIYVCGGLLTELPVLEVLIPLMFIVLNGVMVYHLVMKYKGEESAVAMAIICSIFNFIFPFLLFSLRDAKVIDLEYNMDFNQTEEY